MLVPQPPLDMLIDKNAELYITSALATIAGLALIYSLIQWARTGRPIMLLLFIGGGAMMIFEPMVDTVGACWFPRNSWVGFEAYGRPLPVWLCLAYFFYFGIASALVWMSLKKGMTRAQIWIAFVSAMIGDLLFESALLTVNPYTYYGHQPLWLPNGFPLWWMAVNALIPFVLGAVIYAFDDYFRGWRSLTIVPVALTTSAAVNASVGWPSWLVINTEYSWLVTQLGGVATFALAFAVIQVLCHFVARDARSGVASARMSRPVSV